MGKDVVDVSVDTHCADVIGRDFAQNRKSSILYHPAGHFYIPNL